MYKEINKEGTMTSAQVATKQKEIKAQGYEIFTTYVFLAGSDQDKYGSYMQTRATECAGNNENYPKTLLTAYDILQVHKWDNAGKKKKPNNNNDRKNNNNDKKDENKQETGYILDKKTETSMAQKAHVKNGECFMCGEVHTFNQCKKAGKIPRDDWYVNTEKKPVMAQAAAPASTAATSAAQSTASSLPPTSFNLPPWHTPSAAHRSEFQGAQYCQRIVTETVGTLATPHSIEHQHHQTPHHDLSTRLMFDTGSTINMMGRNVKGKVSQANHMIEMNTNNGSTQHD